MKKLILFGCFIAFTCTCMAQNVVNPRDELSSIAKETEKGSDHVKYKYSDTLDSSTYMLKKSDISSLNYWDGKMETLQEGNTDRQLVSIMKSVDPNLYQQYLRGRAGDNAGAAIVIVGASLIFGGMVGGAIAQSITGDNKSAHIGGYISIGGGILFLIGIPINVAGCKKVDATLNKFRKQYYSSTQPTPQLQFKLYGNGLGLTYRF